MKRWLLRLFELTDTALYGLEVALVSFGLLLMVGLSFTQVAMRNLGEGGVPWFQAVVQHLVLWVGMIGASLCVRERKHIAIEALAKSVSPSGQRVTEALVDVSSALVCVVLARIAWGYIGFHEVPENKVIAEIGPLAIKRSWSLMILPVGFAAMAFRYVHLTVRRIFCEEPVDIAGERLREIGAYERRYSSEDAFNESDDEESEGHNGPEPRGEDDS